MLQKLKLKKSSTENKEKSRLGIFDLKVIIAYIILVITMIMNIVSYKYVPYKIGPIINTLTYIFVIFFGKIFFNELITKNKLIGSAIIIIGIIIYNL